MAIKSGRAIPPGLLSPTLTIFYLSTSRIETPPGENCWELGLGGSYKKGLLESASLFKKCNIGMIQYVVFTRYRYLPAFALLFFSLQFASDSSPVNQ
jgi:hypothetical protein